MTNTDLVKLDEALHVQSTTINTSQVMLEELDRLRDPGGIASDELLLIFKEVADLWLCSILSYVAIISNIVAVNVFKNMGFQDTINISLMSMSIWDIAKGTILAASLLYGPINLVSEALAHSWDVFSVRIFGTLFSTASYISGFVASYVAVERCLCVSLPFTVKFLLTPKVVGWVNIVIALAVIGTTVPTLSMYNFEYIYNPYFNTTVLKYATSSFRRKNPAIRDYAITSFMVYPLVSFAIISIATIITLINLKRASKIRSTTTGTSERQRFSVRDRQVTKMLLTIILFYIISYTPRVCLLIANLSIEELNPQGRYRNISWIATYVMRFFDMINAVVNPFILFFMSSQFRNTLIGMFRLTKTVK